MKLTDEQVEAAAKAAWESDLDFRRARGVLPSWDRLNDTSKDDGKRAARAAAPHIQIPWEPPTIDDVCAVNRATLVSPAGIPLTTYEIISAFIEIRNAALTPKPVDPRIVIVEELLMTDVYADRKERARKIVEALDGAKKCE